MSPLAVVRVCHRTQTNSKANTFDGPFRRYPNRAPDERFPVDAACEMPSARDDGCVTDAYLHEWTDNQVFGFHNPRGLHYFSQIDRDGLLDFVVRHYMVPPGTFRMGREQVMFDPQTAICTHIESL